MKQSKRSSRLYALMLSAVMLLGLFGCNKQEKPAAEKDNPPKDSQSDTPKKPETSLPDPTKPLTEEEYLTLCQHYYDELMEASNAASVKLEEALAAPSETEEQKRLQQNKMDHAMNLMSDMRPMYERFVDLQAPEAYAEAHEMVKSGATASSEVLRLTVEIAAASKKEDGLAEAMVLQKEMEGYTKNAQDFSRGLRMVLGDQVGVGSDFEETPQ